MLAAVLRYAYMGILNKTFHGVVCHWRYIGVGSSHLIIAPCTRGLFAQITMQLSNSAAQRSYGLLDYGYTPPRLENADFPPSISPWSPCAQLN